jgi:hypothetical protein
MENRDCHGEHPDSWCRARADSTWEIAPVAGNRFGCSRQTARLVKLGKIQGLPPHSIGNTLRHESWWNLQEVYKSRTIFLKQV